MRCCGATMALNATGAGAWSWGYTRVDQRRNLLTRSDCVLSKLGRIVWIEAASKLPADAQTTVVPRGPIDSTRY